MKRTCGYCLFAEAADSTDILWCWKVKKHKDVMDPACGAFVVMPKFEEVAGETVADEEKMW